MTVEVSDRPDRHRYEILVDGQLAGIAAYRILSPRRFAFTHTEVDREYEHRGLGSRLIESAMSDVQRRGIEVVPECEFVREYLTAHPEIAVVAEDERARFGL
jgi:predicted GNAT family acetyltransferase